MKNPYLAAVTLLIAAILPRFAAGDVIGYWRFDEGMAGNTAMGSGSIIDSASTNHGTPFGDAFYSPDVVLASIPQNGLTNDLSLLLDGAGDTVLVETDTALDSSGAFTTEFWMKSGDTSAGQKLLVDKSHGFVDSTGWLFQSRPGNGFIDFGVGLGGGGSTNFSVITSQADLFDDQWHHLAGTYDGNQIEFFVDGVSQGSNVVGAYVGNNRDIRLGSASNNGRFFNGNLDEVRISNTALGTSEFLLTSIPEPSSSVVIVATGLVCVLRRKSRREIK